MERFRSFELPGGGIQSRADAAGGMCSPTKCAAKLERIGTYMYGSLCAAPGLQLPPLSLQSPFPSRWWPSPAWIYMYWPRQFYQGSLPWRPAQRCP